MKMIFILLFIFSISFAKADPAQGKPTPDNRAVVVTVLGGFTGFDADGYKAVRAAMAALIIEGVVSQFQTRSYGFEGGNEFCVELAPDPGISIERITKMLDAIKPGNNTAYSYTLLQGCAEGDLAK